MTWRLKLSKTQPVPDYVARRPEIACPTCRGPIRYVWVEDPDKPGHYTNTGIYEARECPSEHEHYVRSNERIQGVVSHMLRYAYCYSVDCTAELNEKNIKSLLKAARDWYAQLQIPTSEEKARRWEMLSRRNFLLTFRVW